MNILKHFFSSLQRIALLPLIVKILQCFIVRFWRDLKAILSDRQTREILLF